MKVSLSLSKTYTSVILFFIKSFIKSIIKFTTLSSVYSSLFTFNTIIKNKKTISEYYKKKITTSLFKVIYLLTLNTYKATITNLKSGL